MNKMIPVELSKIELTSQLQGAGDAVIHLQLLLSNNLNNPYLCF